MVYAVTHFLVVVLLLEIFRNFYVKDKKLFTIHYVFLGGLAGLLPDLDIVIFYILSFFGFTFNQIHRTFSHNLFVVLIFVILAVLFYHIKYEKLGYRHLKLRNIFLVIGFGIFIHLLLDAFIAGSIMPFYPFSYYSVGLNLINLVPQTWRQSILPSLDALMLIIWMVYLEAKHKISSFL
ncbi:MAG: metal-dependent hydrolase [Nanoarchaeota archaeon]